jgi:hypothetical protein
MRLNDASNGRVRPDQVRMTNSMHVVNEKRRSAPGVLILTSMLFLAVIVVIGLMFGEEVLGSYLGRGLGSPVPSALAAESSALTKTVTVTVTVSTPAVTATPSAEETEPALTTDATADEVPTMTAEEAGQMAVNGPKIATAVAATLTAMPTPTLKASDEMATATAESEKIATAVAATLTALPGGPVTTATSQREVPTSVALTATLTVSSSGCYDDLAYMADVTIPDNTQLAPGEAFTKTWQARNTGTCDWEPGYALTHDRYEQMGAPAEVVISDTVPAGEAIEISVPMVAPDVPGKYSGVWQMTNNLGMPFGEVLTVLIVVPGAGGTEAGEDIVLPDVAPVNVEFGYGIQAHMWDAHMEPIVAAVQRLGFNWVKQQTPWSIMEPEKGNYQWGSTDTIADALTANGLNPLFSVVKAPEWARPPTTNFTVEGPPADPQDFANFLGAMAARYKGKVKAYEVWNEQNLHYEWGNEELDPVRYMTLLKLAYVAIKTADPGAVVISGALTPTGAPPPWAIDDYQYLESMYQNGLKESCDAVGAHPSGYNVPPDADWQTWERPGLFFQGPVNNRHHSWSFGATMEGYRNIMLKYDDGAKTLWPTEFGWASSPMPVQNYEYAADNSIEQQAEYTVKAYEMGKAWGWVGVMFLWNLNFKAVSPDSEMAQWGIVDRSWGALPAFNALAVMPK